MLMIIALAVAAPTGASLVHLRCVTMQNDAQVRWEITLNEQAGSVDVASDANGGAMGTRRETATFGADSVRFMDFTLSRVDLTLSRRMTVGGLDLGEETGKCELIKTPERAF